VARSHNHFCRGKAIRVSYCDCVYVALIIQHVKEMSTITLSSVVCLAVPYFFYIISQLSRFSEKLLKIKCILIFNTVHILTINISTTTCQELCFVKIRFVLIFSTAFVCNISRFKRNSGRYYEKCT
jgi:hypothetical protein